MIDLDGTENKSRLGANATVGTSMALARALAASAGIPLWQWITPDGVPPSLPVPHFNVLNGGVHAPNSLDFQEFMIAPVGAPSMAEAVRAGAEVYSALRRELSGRKLSTGLGDEGGFAPEIDNPEEVLHLIVEAITAAGYKAGADGVSIALDLAASEFRQPDGRYRVAGDLQRGEVDGRAVHTTASTVRPALQIIGPKPGARLVSSVLFMCLPDEVVVYGDCAINPQPDAEDLADIAIQSAASARVLGIEPRVAMISFSTGTSGRGSDVDKVAEATRIVREREPDLLVDGPLQYDAAAITSVGQAKRPGSPVAGRASVFVFPDLDTGNTTYKAVQRSARVISIGPMHGWEIRRDGPRWRRVVPSPEPAELLDLPAGSMGPKIDAVCRFVEATGKLAAIGQLGDAQALLAQQAGTVVTTTGR